MKKIIYILLVSVFIFNCNTSKTTTSKKDERLESLKQNDTYIKISDDYKDCEFETNFKKKI